MKCNSYGLHGEKNKSVAAFQYYVIRCVDEKDEDTAERKRKRN